MTKLRPRARIVRTIGDQLISGPEAALIELVKNSFDADSKAVGITITPQTEDSPVGKIIVQDYGHGMTYNDVVNRWFEPATDEKVKQQYSPAGRKLLGAKGIGRFATARLGSKTKLTTISKTKVGKLDQVIVDIDWNAFSSEKYLDELDIPITRKTIVEKKPPHTGVLIQIEDLRDLWTKKKIENLIRELKRVATAENEGDRFDIHLNLVAFTIASAGFDGAALMAELNSGHDSDFAEPLSSTLIVPFKIHKFADYRLHGVFSPDGAFNGVFSIPKGDGLRVPLKIPALSLLPDETPCGSVDLDINVYDLETESVAALFGRMEFDFEKIGIKAARKVLTENAGISIFRNKFRIRPYGEPENDWLELERKRVQNPSKKLGISQVSGRVTVSDEASSSLVERSSREGLEHNGSFERLKRLLDEVFLHIEERRFTFRQNAGLSRRVAGDMTKAKEQANLGNVSKAVASLPPAFQTAMLVAIDRDRKALTESLDELDAFQKLLQSRAALGLLVARVIHEGRRFLNPMAASTRMLSDQQDVFLVDSAMGKLARKQLPQHLEIINHGAKNLGKLFKQLDPISGRKRGRPNSIEVKTVIKTTIDLLSEALASAKIKVVVSVDDDLTAYGYADDLQNALLNLIDNAIYWLDTIDIPKREINVTGIALDRKVRLSIQNNGPLIDAAYVPQLFSAGFSLKSDGTGIGLTIAREACRSSKGDLIFDDSAINTTFHVDFPKPI
jgi:signal transduction histidine kinase